MAEGFFSKEILSGIGTVWIAGTKRGILRIEFGGTRSSFLSKLSPDIAWREDSGPLRPVIFALKAFAAGEGIGQGAKADLSAGTHFQRRVWRAIAAIPWGETRSYAWLARAAGRPRAVRAAANACGANPIPIVIPCHRVIASDGRLGGFSSGLAMKRRLLALENRLK